MPLNYHDLTYFDVGIASTLILINGIISIKLKLGLEKQLLIASVRTVVQLVLVGLVLQWVFQKAPWFAILLLLGVMTLIAGVSAVQRVDRRFPGIWLNSITAVTAGSWLVTFIALTAIIRYDTWSDHLAQYAVPLLGMILGNTLNGISLGLNQLGEQLVTHRARVELLLTLGATRWEAARHAVRSAVRTGMTPIINAMMVVGLVSLPGMMTGQLLAGASPVEAVKYQIMIMFLIAAGTALGTICVVLLSYTRLFNSRHQFLYEQIRLVKNR